MHPVPLGTTTTTAGGGAPSCAPCVALFSFLLGAFGGYVLSAALGHGGGRGGGGGGGGGGTEGGRGRGGCEEEVDDEGNVVRGPMLGSGRRGGCGAGGAGGGGRGRGAVMADGEEDGGCCPVSAEAEAEAPRSVPSLTPTDASEEGEEEEEEEAVGGEGAPGPPKAAPRVGVGVGDGGGGPIRLAVRTFRSASLRLGAPGSFGSRPGADAAEGAEEGPTGHTRGLLVYVSFAGGADESMLHDAALALLNAPLLSGGDGGDGGPRSVLRTAADEHSGGDPPSVAVIIVHQADLISENQIDRPTAEDLYNQFIRRVELIVAPERSRSTRGGGERPPPLGGGGGGGIRVGSGRWIRRPASAEGLRGIRPDG